MTGSMAAIKADGCASVDVREVALAHLQGVKLDQAANKRFLLAN